MKTATVSDTEVSFMTGTAGASARERALGSPAIISGAGSSRHGNTRRAGGFSRQRLAGVNPCRFHDVFAELEMIGRQHDDRRSVLEPAELNAFVDFDIAR